MAKRLTVKQKKELVDCFKSGTPINVLSKDFNCTKLTIIRNLKKDLGVEKYKELNIEKKLFKVENIEKETESEVQKKQDNETLKNAFKESKISKDYKDGSGFPTVDSFVEIAPLDFEIGDLSRKELTSIPLSEVNLPKVVYLVVDKKIDLEIKFLKDFPGWDFLPSEDLNRKTIEIYSDLNLAKRSCHKEQKVIKVPNSDVFKMTAPNLLAKGISRIINDQNLISL